jgi:hypothetical protein
MAKILLLNFDDDFGSRLAAFLRNEHHDILPSCISSNCTQNSADLVIIDVSQREKVFERLLKEIVTFRAQHGPRPMILCISHVYRGPRFQLDLEQKGARLLYV